MEYYCDSLRRPASGMAPADIVTDPSSAIAGGMASNFNNSRIFASSSTTMLATPPPELPPAEYNPLSYPYSFPYQYSDVSHFSGSLPFSPSDYYLQGSSLQDSPLSSPSSEVGREELESTLGTNDCKQSSLPLANFQLRSFLQDSDQFVSSYSNELEEPPIPDGIKMPKRKGGIQLWQFLYALLTDPENMHPELIEWTCNRAENEFRLLEPEAIAIWWGYHKNKVNINYEKFSRSLRYYYDKGILRKIPGERYVYRFCIDPERMYKHIGILDCRPEIKPMPEGARQAISKFQGEQSQYHSLDLPIVALAPEPLQTPISPSNSDSLKYLLPPVSSYTKPIERSSSFKVVYPQNLANPLSEELPRSASLPDMNCFESFSATQSLYNSPAVPSVRSNCDVGQSHMIDSIGHDFDAGYNYNSSATVSETLWFQTYANENCFFASQHVTWHGTK